MRKISLRELPGYIKNLGGKIDFNDDVVVDMGKISGGPSYFKIVALSLATFCFVGILSFRLLTKEVIINSELSPSEVASNFSDIGGVVSVRRDEDVYRVRVFSLDGKGLLDRLRSKNVFKSVYLK